MKRILCFAVATIALCLATPTVHAQSDSLKLRVHVPFSFTVDNTMFDAGDYIVTEPANGVIRVQNLVDRTSAFQHVQSAHSRNESDGRIKLVFHRYGAQYFLAVVSDRTWESTFDLQMSNREELLANVAPKPQLNVVSVLANGSVESANAGR
jgi:hypothetical protein